MPKIVIQNLKIWMLSLFSVSLLFFTFLFLQNGSTLIITMNSTAKSPLNAQLFFAKEGQPYIEKNSGKAHKIKKNNYYFKLPKPEEMHYVRFDPAKKESEITIKKITLSTTKWFETKLYDVPTTNIFPAHQIEQFKIANNVVSFTTTGNDPHFNMSLTSSHISTTFNTHLNLFIIAILLFTVIMYLSHIYKTHRPDKNLNLTLDKEDFSICRQ